MLSKDIIKELDKTIARVIVSLYDEQDLIADGNDFIIGSVVIKKENLVYNIYNRLTGSILYSDIFLIESALLITKYQHSNDYVMLKEVISLDNKYAKHYLDLKCYLNSIKVRSSAGKYIEAQIAEDRYRIAKNDAKLIRIKIKNLSNKIIRNR